MANPVFASDTFTQFERAYETPRTTAMTVNGTVGKTFALLAVLSATAIWAWNATLNGEMQMEVLVGASLGAFVLALVTTFKPTAAPWTAPVYAALEGVALGILSCVIENKLGRRYQGIAMQAVALTGGTLCCMLFAYASRLIRVTEKLKAGIVAAIGAVLLVKLVALGLMFFGYHNPFPFASTGPGIIFSVVVVGIAAFSLLLDFDFIEQGARAEAPKVMEWYGAFGLMVTLIWLYLEILRLLLKLQDRR